MNNYIINHFNDYVNKNYYYHLQKGLLMRKRLLGVLGLYYLNKIPPKIIRRYSVRPLNAKRDSNQEGDGFNLINSLRTKDPEAHFEYCRMSVETFDKLFERVQPLIKKQDTQFRKAIPAMHRLYITLKFLAHGESISTLAQSYRIGKSTTSKIIRDVCDAIWDVLQDELFVPTKENWEKVAEGFKCRWHFPNCIGAIDGKHIAIKCPNNAGSTYYNYKGYHSIVLLAIVDASYRFMMVDIGSQGRHSDAGIFLNSIFGRKFRDSAMNVPPPFPINADPLEPEAPPIVLPYVLAGDAAFGLTKFSMTPYEGRNIQPDEEIFNYRLSRARRVVENAFGILQSRFNIFKRTIDAAPETVDSIVKACVVLHNFLMKTDKYCPQEYRDLIDNTGQVLNHNRNLIADAECAFQSVGQSGCIPHSRYVTGIRNKFKKYFVTEGQVPWQHNN